MGISNFVSETAQALRSVTSRVTGVDAPLTKRTAFDAAASLPAYVSLETTGKYVSVEGIRLHYLEAGAMDAPPIVYIHGANAYAQELFAGPLGRLLARNYRVIAFDRPGFGRSERAADMAGPLRQAAIIHAAVAALGIEKPLLVGHSWGGALSLAYGIAYGRELTGIVNMSGWCYPSNRLLVSMIAMSVGPYMQAMKTLVPPRIARQMGRRMLERVFEPDPIPGGFSRFSMDVAMRDSQMAANGEDLKALNPSMATLESAYAGLTVPMEILVAMRDRIVEPERHGLKLAGLLPSVRLTRIEDHGHMAHHLDPMPFVAAVNRLMG